MRDDQLIPDLVREVELSIANTDALRRRVAALKKMPGEQFTAQMKSFAGLTELVAALDAYGRRPDPSTETVFDKIRREMREKQAKRR